MIGKLLFFLVLAIPMACKAETYLCIGEAGAAVEHGGPSGIDSAKFDAKNQKYLISNSSGSWQFREYGENGSALVCDSEYYCEIKDGFGSVFFREREGNVFTYIFLQLVNGNPKHQKMISVKGRCTKL